MSIANLQFADYSCLQPAFEVPSWWWQDCNCKSSGMFFSLLNQGMELYIRYDGYICVFFLFSHDQKSIFFLNRIPVSFLFKACLMFFVWLCRKLQRTKKQAWWYMDLWIRYFKLYFWLHRAYYMLLGLACLNSKNLLRCVHPTIWDPVTKFYVHVRCIVSSSLLV